MLIDIAYHPAGLWQIGIIGRTKMDMNAALLTSHVLEALPFS